MHLFLCRFTTETIWQCTNAFTTRGALYICTQQARIAGRSFLYNRSFFCKYRNHLSSRLPIGYGNFWLRQLRATPRRAELALSASGYKIEFYCYFISRVCNVYTSQYKCTIHRAENGPRNGFDAELTSNSRQMDARVVYSV